MAYWGALCLHTAPTETYSPSKGRNFGNTSSSSSVPLVVISYLYFVFSTVVEYFLLALVVIVGSIIYVAHLVIILENLYVANPNLLRKAKNW